MNKKIKTFVSVVLSVFIMIFAVACGGGGENPAPSDYARPSNVNIDESFTQNSNVLVAYFSKTNTTKGVAEKIAELTGADIFEIVRKDPYPEVYTPTTEEARDEKEANARPELAAYLPDEVMARYDTIILGFPIWWHTAPMPVLSFLNYYDMSGKTIYTFCTAVSSPITESTADVRTNAKGATVVEGRRFSSGSDSSIETWLDSIDLHATPEQSDDPSAFDPPQDNRPGNENTNTLVVYFSATGSTERVARYIANATSGDLFELVPVNPYSSDDLNYGDSNSRVVREHENESLQDIALVSTVVTNWENYDTVFIGYPIWWQIAAWPVNNFIKNNDFTGKTVIPFATSASSGLGQSGVLLAQMAGTGNWQAGQRFSSGASESTVRNWVLGLNLAA